MGVENYGMPPMQYYAVFTLFLTIVTLLFRKPLFEASAKVTLMGFIGERGALKKIILWAADGRGALKKIILWAAGERGVLTQMILMASLAGCILDALCIMISHCVFFVEVGNSGTGCCKLVPGLLGMGANLILLFCAGAVYFVWHAHSEESSIPPPRESS